MSMRWTWDYPQSASWHSL